MKAKIENAKIKVMEQKNINRLNERGYGRFIEDEILELHPVEALYLYEGGKIKLLDEENKILDIETYFDIFSKLDDRFEQKFIVYRDLKKRGYKINCFHELRDKGIDYFLKPKRIDQKDIFVVSVNEREKFSIKDVISFLSYLDHLIEELWIGVVDEEGDITYYKINSIEPKGNIEEIKNIGCRGILLKDLVIIKDSMIGKEIFDQGFYGNLSDKELMLSLIEALHLIDLGVLDVYSHGKKIDFDELLEISRFYQPDIEHKYRVYRDLKNRKLCVKTGYKFGTNFRAYERNPRRYHAEYLIDVVKADFESSWSNISRAVRLSHSVRKIYVLAVVKDKIEYIGMERIKP